MYSNNMVVTLQSSDKSLWYYAVACGLVWLQTARLGGILRELYLALEPSSPAAIWQFFMTLHPYHGASLDTSPVVQKYLDSHTSMG